MADLNSLIAQGAQFNMPDQLGQFAKLQQIQQGAQQLQASQTQNKVSQMQLEDLQRDRADMLKFQDDLAKSGKSTDLHAYADMMMKSPKHFQMGVELKQKLLQQDQFNKIMGGGGPTTAPAAAPFSAAQPPSGALGSGTFDPNAPVNALAPAAATPAAPANALAQPSAGNPLGGDVAALRQKRDAFLAMGTPQAIAAAKALDSDIAIASKEPIYHNVPGVGLVDPRTGKVITASVETTQPDIKKYEYAKSQGYKGTLFDFQREMAIAGRPPAQPRPEQPPVAVVDPTTGKQVLVSREEALKGRMTPATAMEGLTPKEIQTREAKYPQATLAVKTFESKADKLAADLKTLANHPGLSGISGLIYGRTPAVTAAARQAQTLYDSIVARGGFSELQAMRSASPTGGALGNVSEREGQYLRDAFAAIGRTQDTKDLKKSLLDASKATIAAKQNARDAYDMTYDYKTGANPAAAAPAAAPAGGAPGAKPTVSNW